MLPIVAANRAVLVGTDHVVDEHVRFLPTPGHTPNHFSLLVGDGGASAVVTGDALHSPLQTQYPELSYAMDIDPALAGQTRRNLLERICEDRRTLLHRAFPVAERHPHPPVRRRVPLRLSRFGRHVRA